MTEQIQTKQSIETSGLLPQHRRLLTESAISDEVARARQYQTVTKKADLAGLGFGVNQRRVPALLTPVYSVSGEIATYQIRPDQPRVNRDGKAVKYETPAGTRMVVDVPPMIRSKLRDPAVPLFITEGVRKADAAVSHGLCCVALLGVWNWRGTNELGGKLALPDWEAIALNGRQVYICFDSDVMTKPAVQQALIRLKEFLESRKAVVSVIYLPPSGDGAKMGLDDYLAAGHGVGDLLSLASSDLHPIDHDGANQATMPYAALPSGLVWRKPTHDGTIEVPLTNFSASIVAEVVEDDGAESRRSFEIEASLRGRKTTFSVPSSQFAAMNWPIEALGASAIVYPGFGLREHARAAIQFLSGETIVRQVYAHTGWRKIEGQWVYLHGGGAIGAEGPVSGMQVSLPDALAGFALPVPPGDDELREAIRTALDIIEIAPDVIMVPLYSGAWRAAMGGTDFSLHLAGPTGTGKSELAALVQQHWGPGLSARHLPGSWSSTGNALEGLAFTAKDTIIVVDDFAPSGSQTDVARLHREAERILRAQGNSSGRLRMRADASLRPAKAPRGMVLSTGEDVPKGQSLRARMLVLEVSPNSLRWDLLTELQRQAASGLFAGVMAGFVKWYAARYEQIQSGMPDEIRKLRQQASQGAGHRRTPEIVANLMLGFTAFLRFAQDIAALSEEEVASLWERAWDALGKAAAGQDQHQEATEPTQRFLGLVRAAIASGRAHVADPSSGVPRSPEAWGWRRGIYEATRPAPNDWHPQGACIGWLVGNDLYLEPDASYLAAQEIARNSGDSLAVAQRTLHRRLSERNLLESTDDKRRTLTVRHMLAGSRRSVLHLNSELIMPTGTDQTPGMIAEMGRFVGSCAGPL